MMHLTTSANATRLQMPVAGKPTHVVTMGAPVAGVNLAKYGVKHASLGFVSVDTMILVGKIPLENIVMRRKAYANAHPILMHVVEIDPNV